MLSTIGTVGSCMAGTSFILNKIVHSETGCDYVVKGTISILLPHIYKYAYVYIYIYYYI